MKRTFLLSMIFCLSLLVSLNAFAMEFSADVVNKAGGKVVTSKIFIKNNKFRMENRESGVINIVRQDLKKSWMIMPGQKTYMEVKIDPSVLPREKMQGELDRKFIGQETIDGHPCKKYMVTYSQGKSIQKSYQWVATDINFPIKTAALDGSWSMEYKNIRMGPQADSQFEPPAGYQKMTMPAMPGGFKGMMPGRR
ncbi:MAG: DUF4412 domain-containing protein [Deltaproteobacteria bacterium]|nr:DUF4412 domain-containing protein [Deltaproteobacteria bacterium]